MINMLLKLHSEVPELKVPTYLMLSKATSPIFPQQTKKFLNKNQSYGQNRNTRATLNRNCRHTHSELKSNPYCFLWAILSAPAICFE